MDSNAVPQDVSPPDSHELTAVMSRSEMIQDAAVNNNESPKDLRFWLIITALLVASFIAALDQSGNLNFQLFRYTRKSDIRSHKKAVTIALPTVAHALKSTDFTWIGNAFSIAATSVIPL